MSSPAVSCVRHLMEEYRRFLRSTYRLADPHLRQQFEQHVNQTDVLVKSPYVTLARDYGLGKTLGELVAGGIGHRDLLRLKWSFGANPIYTHQETAFRLADAENRNCVIKTGTGSGKADRYPNLTVKKIPKAVMARCEWGHDDYSLRVEDLPKAPPKPGQMEFELWSIPRKTRTCI